MMVHLFSFENGPLLTILVSLQAAWTLGRISYNSDTAHELVDQHVVEQLIQFVMNNLLVKAM